MRTHQIQEIVELSKKDGTFNKIMANSMEAGHPFPSKLRGNLEAAGYKVEVEKRSVLTSVTVLKDNEIVAKGMSVDEHEALLLAIYREMQSGN